MLAGLAVVLVATGGVLAWTGMRGGAPRHQVSALGSIPTSVPSSPPGSAAPSRTRVSGSCTGEPAAGEPAAAAPMDASRPVSVSSSCIGLDSGGMMNLGLNSDGSVQVPPLLSGKTGWYQQSPTPGQKGPAIILGHVDSYRGPSVFYHLDELEPGQQVTVGRADGTKAHFTVDAIRQYSKDEFPTKKIYGAVDYPALRLITCGGAFDEHAKSYESNTVAYAHLTRPAESGS
jgi:hypothetical protein